MNLARRLIFRSLRFHARSHLGTFLGVAVASAVLVGALAVGDCVRGSLRQMQEARLGKVEFALASKDRFFRQSLAQELGGQTAAALQLSGIAANSDGTARANRVQVLGVDDSFWAMAPKKTALSQTNESIALNAALAQQLQVKVGDTVLVRVQKPSLLPAETPLATREGSSIAFRWPVGAIVSDAQFGRFSLQASQVPPCTAFVPLSLLQDRLALPGKANLLLVAQGADGPALTERLRKNFRLADAELELRPWSGGVELISRRVFLDPPVARAATNAPTARPISTYFVNELRVGDKSTPYSTVTAMGEPVVQAGMGDDEIIVNQWLADDLEAHPGDVVQLTYLVLGDRRLEERHDRFRIRAIVPLEGAAADRALMPEFPGLAKAEKTQDWDAGFPLDTKKIRPKDEQYWKEHRGTPKAFVTSAAGERMWRNRFGELTAVRFSEASAAAIESSLLRGLDPASLGFAFAPVRQQAIAASTQSEDFGGLFIGFSFFLIIAALILLALLFQFGVEKRASEAGILLALGLPPRQVRRLWLGEGIAIAALGGLAGALCGLAYAKGILYGLTTLWRAAVGTSSLEFHVTAITLVAGGGTAILMGIGVIWLALRQQGKRPARELLEQGAELESPAPSKRAWAGWLAALSALGALGLVGNALRQGDTASTEAFFGGGALLLIAGISAAAFWLRKLAGKKGDVTLTALGVRGCARRRKRSLATIALLASGAFLIVAVEANKLDATQSSRERSSGTGGFALLAESSLPVVADLNSKAGREFFGLSDLPAVDVVPLRVRDGDDASCLNLNRAQNPRLLGVNAELLQSRKAFTFTKTLVDSAEPWALLKASPGSDAVPAVADEASIVWALGKKVGDTLDYTDERGSRFPVRLVGSVANSILQGNVIIDESEFVKHFPGESGYRMFLIDAPEPAKTSATLTRALQDFGLEVTPAAQRLNAFNAVQNTYLNTFQILGGLGLLLGSAGLGVVVLRNVLERRGESAVLLAVGFRPRAVCWWVFSEHAALLLAGLLLGIGSALVAVLPALLSPAAQVSWRSLALVLGLVLVSGLFWTWFAARLALRGDLLAALRNE